jgi:hypothetical protein
VCPMKAEKAPTAEKYARLVCRLACVMFSFSVHGVSLVCGSSTFVLS